MPSPAPIEVGMMAPGDRPQAVVATARAFWPDPVFGFFARDAIHEHHATGFFGANLDDCHRHGDVWVARSGTRVVGTACWLSGDAVHRTPARDARIGVAVVRSLGAGRHRPAAIRLLTAMEKHHPREEHHYLVLLGVDPEFKGRGVGRQLLEPGLRQADEAGMPCYLETQKPENVPFYARFGFEQREELRVAGAPPLWLLWREPRPLDR